MRPRYRIDTALLVQMILEEAHVEETDKAFAYADHVTFNVPVPLPLRDMDFDALVATYKLPDQEPTNPTLWQRFTAWAKRLLEENAKGEYAETFASRR